MGLCCLRIISNRCHACKTTIVMPPIKRVALVGFSAMCCLALLWLYPLDSRDENTSSTAFAPIRSQPHRSQAHKTLQVAAAASPIIPRLFHVPMMLAVVPVDGNLMNSDSFARLQLALRGWVEHLLLPLKNIHIVLLWTKSRGNGAIEVLSEEDVVRLVGLERLNSTHFTLPRPHRFPVLLMEVDVDGLSFSSRCAKSGAMNAIEWWLSEAMFHHRMVRNYVFVVRMTHDLFFFRRPRYDMVGDFVRRQVAFAHVGSGAAVEGRFAVVSTSAVRATLHEASAAVDAQQSCGEFASAAESWYQLVVQRGSPAMNVMSLQWMLWQRRVMRRDALFYFALEPLGINELKQWTRLRWSRYRKETAEF